ncbi:MAG TPA: APC family permease [Candidatus Acidoferrales bacterium]|nr:APC family permease [Candidatus Acidoferrales bacterium]
MNESTSQTSVSPPPVAIGRLLKVLGVGFGIAVGVGDAISAGILRTPGEIATRLTVPWLFITVWIGGGLYALVSSFSLAELGAMIPREGGQFVFSRRALGDYAGFVVGWGDWVSTCGATAAISIVFGEYSSRLIPFLAGRAIEAALALVLAITLLQWRGVRSSSRTQNLTSAVKALLFLGVVVMCFIVGGPGRPPAAASAGVPRGLSLLVAMVVATQAVIYTYDGWDGIVYFLEEVRDPGREVPRAMFGSVLSIMAIYVLLNIGLIHLIPPASFAGSDFALGLAAQRIFGPRGVQVVMGVMAISLVSGMSANQLMASRVLFAMGRDGFFSRRTAQVNPGGTPTVALFLSAAVAVAFIATGSFARVIAVAAFFFVANYLLSFLSVFVLRWRQPATPRPYRAWGYPWTTGLALAGSFGFLVAAVAGDTRNSLWALAMLAISYPVYRLSKALRQGMGDRG